MKTSIKPLLVIICIAITGFASAQTVTPDDKAFVAKVSQGGMFEVAAGRLAMVKGSTQDIRDFAAAEVHDHMLVGAKLKKISAEAGITFSLTPTDNFSAALKYLSSLSGLAFDQAYLHEMSKLHHIDGGAFSIESTKGGTAALRDFGNETHRIVLRHIGAIIAVSAG